MFQASKTILKKCIQKAILEHMPIASCQTSPKLFVTDFISDYKLHAIDDQICPSKQTKTYTTTLVKSIHVNKKDGI